MTRTVALDDISNMHAWLYYKWNDFGDKLQRRRIWVFFFLLCAQHAPERRKRLWPLFFRSLHWWESDWNKSMPLKGFSAINSRWKCNRFHFGFRHFLLFRFFWLLCHGGSAVDAHTARQESARVCGKRRANWLRNRIHGQHAGDTSPNRGFSTVQLRTDCTSCKGMQSKVDECTFSSYFRVVVAEFWSLLMFLCLILKHWKHFRVNSFLFTILWQIKCGALNIAASPCPHVAACMARSLWVGVWLQRDDVCVLSNLPMEHVNLQRGARSKITAIGVRGAWSEREIHFLRFNFVPKLLRTFNLKWKWNPFDVENIWVPEHPPSQPFNEIHFVLENDQAHHHQTSYGRMVKRTICSVETVFSRNIWSFSPCQWANGYTKIVERISNLVRSM